MIGIVIGGTSFYLTDRLVPIGNIKFRTLFQRLTIARPDVQIEVHSINEISAQYTLLVDIVDEKTGDLMDVTIFESKEGKFVKTITARKGWFLSEGATDDYITLRLIGGTIADPKDRTGEQFNSTVFSNLDLNIPLEKEELKNIVKKPRDMSMKELNEGMEKEEKGTRLHNIYLIEYNKKIAIPFACVLFVFLGTPFAVTRGRSGKGLGLGIGVLIIFLYYLALLTLERKGKQGVIPPSLAIWLPNILFFIVGTANLIKRGRT